LVQPKVRHHLDDPLALAFAHDEMLGLRVMPWYQVTVANDRMQMAHARAAIEGRPAPQPMAPAGLLELAMQYDPTLFRAYLETVSLLALPDEVLARPGIAGRILELAEHHVPLAPSSPSRDELLRIVA
jgi:hypothetical protein